jgi:hypothetical protein
MKEIGILGFWGIEARVGGQGRSCRPKVALHRWTLELFLDLHEGPTRHLTDLWPTFQRVDLTSLGALYLVYL